MDRPEWLAIDPLTNWVYCTLTNNSSRGRPDAPGVDAANPRANNTMGQIIRWQEERDFDAGSFNEAYGSLAWFDAGFFDDWNGRPVIVAQSVDPTVPRES